MANTNEIFQIPYSKKIWYDTEFRFLLQGLHPSGGQWDGPVHHPEQCFDLIENASTTF